MTESNVADLPVALKVFIYYELKRKAQVKLIELSRNRRPD